MMTTAERNPDTGHTITLTAIGWYEGVWASLSAMEVIALDERGFHADAAAYLEPFIAWQGTMDPPGEFKTKDGFLASNDPYTWVRWISNHGFLLWAMANHYRMSDDRAWLEAKLPNMLAAVDWIERERARTKKLNADGTKPPHWGLLPPGPRATGCRTVTASWATPSRGAGWTPWPPCSNKSAIRGPLPPGPPPINISKRS